jgi:hypothetical protein
VYIPVLLLLCVAFRLIQRLLFEFVGRFQESVMSCENLVFTVVCGDECLRGVRSECEKLDVDGGDGGGGGYGADLE